MISAANSVIYSVRCIPTGQSKSSNKSCESWLFELGFFSIGLGLLKSHKLKLPYWCAINELSCPNLIAVRIWISLRFHLRDKKPFARNWVLEKILSICSCWIWETFIKVLLFGRSSLEKIILRGFWGCWGIGLMIRKYIAWENERFSLKSDVLLAEELFPDLSSRTSEIYWANGQLTFNHKWDGVGG
mgnify:CR=1 FL=1